MDKEPQISPGEQATPSAELRERILTLCHQEMAKRRAEERRRQRQWRWSFAAGVAALLLLNGVEEQRSDAHINQLVVGRAQVVRTLPASPAIPGSLRLRRLLLAALLKDPNSL
jgi:hypothetical protein